MESWKPEQVQQIWQRVQGHKDRDSFREDVCSGITELYAGEIQDSTLLFQLSRYFSGHNAALLRAMAREDQSHAAQIRGICAISNKKPVVSQSRETGRPVILLQRCCGRKTKRIYEYENRASDPHYGYIFRKMAEQEQSHCRKLLSIIGRIQK